MSDNTVSLTVKEAVEALESVEEDAVEATDRLVEDLTRIMKEHDLDGPEQSLFVHVFIAGFLRDMYGEDAPVVAKEITRLALSESVVSMAVGGEGGPGEWYV